jgi:hypothetical protein
MTNPGQGPGRRPAHERVLTSLRDVDRQVRLLRLGGHRAARLLHALPLVLAAHPGWATEPGLLEVCRKAMGDLRGFVGSRGTDPAVRGVLELCDGVTAAVDELLAAIPRSGTRS